MAETTEAACLLEKGAMYGKRLLLQPPGGDPIFAGFRPGVFSLYFGDAPIYHFDREGRWQRAFVAGTHYLKGLDGSVQAIDRVREGENLVLKRRTLSYAESSDRDAQVRAAAVAVLEVLGRGELERSLPPAPAQALADDELRDALEEIVRWDAAAWFAHRERYLETYAPLPFLPPDAQAAVVLQATLGHAGSLAFGGAPADEHAVRSPREFASHVQAVRRLLGRRTEQCRTLFLAGSDALCQGAETVAAYLEAAAAGFPIEAPGAVRPRRVSGPGAVDREMVLQGIDSFLDDFRTPELGWPPWNRLRQRHLRRVSLGVESGAEEVRAVYDKHWSNDDLRTLVAQLKDAGLGVGVLVLTDAGGVEHAVRHRTATAELLNGLPLGPGDLVSLLDANELRDPLAPAGAGRLGFTPLTGRAWADQLEELKRLLKPVRSERGAKVAPYSLEKQGA